MGVFVLFAGALASHAALKQHAEALEASLAQRESSVAALGAHVHEELGRKDNEVRTRSLLSPSRACVRVCACVCVLYHQLGCARARGAGGARTTR